MIFSFLKKLLFPKDPPTTITLLNINDKNNSSSSREILPNNNQKINFKDTFKNQKFALPEYILERLLNTTNGKLYDKLIRTCKYFYSQNRKVTVNHFRISYSDLPSSLKKFYIKRFSTCSYSLPSKIWIIDEFHFNLYESFEMKKIIPNIYRCDAASVYFGNAKLTENEFNFIINPNTVKDLYLDCVKIFDSNGCELNLTKIISKILNATKIGFYLGFGLPHQTENLSSLLMNAKIESFKIVNVREKFDVVDYFQFLGENIAEKANLILHYHPGASEKTIQNAKMAFRDFTNNSQNKRKIKFDCQ